jgi:hypothetical protein
VFDAMRLLFGIVMLYAAVTKTFGEDMTHPKTGLILLTGAGAAAVLMIAYCIRERRRLARVEGALRPVEMVKEFPPPRADSGRFMAGGLLYFNRENPVMIARGAQGIALNLAHPGIYVWVAYLSGLVVLTFWQFRA